MCTSNCDIFINLGQCCKITSHYCVYEQDHQQHITCYWQLLPIQQYLLFLGHCLQKLCMVIFESEFGNVIRDIQEKWYFNIWLHRFIKVNNWRFSSTVAHTSACTSWSFLSYHQHHPALPYFQKPINDNMSWAIKPSGYSTQKVSMLTWSTS